MDEFEQAANSDAMNEFTSGLFPGENADKGTSTQETETADQAQAVSTEVADDETVDAAKSSEQEATVDQEEQPEDGVQEEPQEEPKFQPDEAYTIEEFAEAFEVEDPSQIKLVTTVNGEKGSISLQEALRSHQVEASQTRKAQQFALEEKRRLDDWVARSDQLTQSLATSQALSDHIRNVVKTNYDAKDIIDLKESDPGAYSAKILERDELFKQLDTVEAQVGAYARQMDMQREQLRQAMIADTVTKILGTSEGDTNALIPEWHDRETYNSESNMIREYMLNLGYTEKQTTEFTDPRFVQMARDAALYRSGRGQVQAQKEITKKKVNRLPKAKIARSTSPASKEQSSKRVRDDTVKRLKETGDLRDAVAVVDQMLPDEFY